MKKFIILFMSTVALVGLVMAAQDVTIERRDVEDAVKLRALLIANATDAQTRISSVEAAGVGGALASGKIIVGNSGGTGEAQTVTGDISLSNAGVSAIASGVIVDADIKTNALIASTKLSVAAQASLAKADSALQPNLVTVTNVIVSADAKTNTIIVVGGQLTSWVVTQ